ncbi:MAG: AbrB/MazE/SpoVT family DNA-binding domain-containing protein [Pseudomonadota bacterium]|jgi:hypothetical protein
MLAKLTAKNQLTLPKAAVEAVGASEYFDVAVRDGQILLTPVRIQRGDAVRAKLAELGLGDADVAAAVAWARGPAKPLRVAESPGGYGDKGAKTRQRTRRKPAARP